MTDDTRPTTPPSPGRRGFLNTLLGGGSAALMVAILYPVLRFVLPPKLTEAMTSRVVAGKADELTPGSGKIFKFGNKPGLLLRTPEGEYRAFLAVCTHLNCTVQYRQDRNQIWCACHNGYYDLRGRVISGPPPTGLPEFQVDQIGDEIIVSKTRTVT